MKKLLIISNTFFPDPVVAAIRITEWCRHLPETGWKPTVVCRHYGFDSTGPQLAAAVSPDVAVNYVGPRRPAHPTTGISGTNKRLVRRITETILSSFLVPDVMIIKQRQIFFETLKQARECDPDVILSTGPHHSLHWLGRKVAMNLAKPWVADFRDPYIIDIRSQPTGMGKLSWFRHKAFERAIYDNADLCLHAIPLHYRWARHYYRQRRPKIRLLTNGIPDELLVSGPVAQRNESSHSTVLVPLKLECGIYQDLAKIAGESTNVKFRFVLCCSPPENADALQETSGHAFEFCGRLPYMAFIERLKQADILVGYLSKNRAAGLGLSSKLFEFLATGKPVININSTRSDRLFLMGKPWCIQLEQPNQAELEDALNRARACHCLPDREWLENFRNEYSRRNQTRTLATWLNALA